MSILSYGQESFVSQLLEDEGSEIENLGEPRLSTLSAVKIKKKKPKRSVHFGDREDAILSIFEGQRDNMELIVSRSGLHGRISNFDNVSSRLALATALIPEARDAFNLDVLSVPDSSLRAFVAVDPKDPMNPNVCMSMEPPNAAALPLGVEYFSTEELQQRMTWVRTASEEQKKMAGDPLSLWLMSGAAIRGASLGINQAGTSYRRTSYLRQFTAEQAKEERARLRRKDSDLVGSLQSQLNAAMSELNRRQSLLSASGNNEERLERENAMLKELLSQAGEAGQALVTKNEALVDEREKLMEENHNLKEETEDLQDATRLLQGEVEELRSRVGTRLSVSTRALSVLKGDDEEELVSQVASLERQNKALTKQLTSMKQWVRGTRESLDNVDKAISSHSRGTGVPLTVDEELNKAKEMLKLAESQLDDLRKDYDQTAEDNTALRQRCDEMEEAMTEFRASGLDELKSLRNENSVLHEQIIELSRALALDRAENQRLKEAKDERFLKSLTKEIEAEAASVAKSRHSTTDIEHLLKMAEVNELKNRLEEAMNDVACTRDRLQAAQERWDNLESRMVTLDREVEQKNARIEYLEEELARRSVEPKDLVKEVPTDVIRDIMKERVGSADILERVVQETPPEVIQQLRENEEDLAFHRKELASLRLELENERQAQQSLKASADKVEELMAERVRLMENHENERNQIRKELEEQKRALESAKEDTVTALMQGVENKNLKQRLEQEMAEADSIRRRLGSVTEQKALIQARLRNLERDIKLKDSRLENMEGELVRRVAPDIVPSPVTIVSQEAPQALRNRLRAMEADLHFTKSEQQMLKAQLENEIKAHATTQELSKKAQRFMDERDKLMSQNEADRAKFKTGLEETRRQLEHAKVVFGEENARLKTKYQKKKDLLEVIERELETTKADLAIVEGELEKREAPKKCWPFCGGGGSTKKPEKKPETKPEKKPEKKPLTQE